MEEIIERLRAIFAQLSELEHGDGLRAQALADAQAGIASAVSALRMITAIELE